MSLDLELKNKYGDVAWERNITHNLSKLARVTSLYSVLWDSNEAQAGEALPALRYGHQQLCLTMMLGCDKDYLPANGWGTTENLLDFVESLIEACEKYGDGTLTSYR